LHNGYKIFKPPYVFMIGELRYKHRFRSFCIKAKLLQVQKVNRSEFWSIFS